ncbi:MAG: AsmA-like C-terminal domain-containing protein [Alphaproteobacteria bacterium]|nr:AsmA-like C-terminal domain-containing protein [Alphaproteobacteria bacterium]
MKKLSPRAYFLRKVFNFFMAGMFLVFLLFMWTLYRGPISVPYLKPYIVQALNYDENDYAISIGDVNIEFVRSIQPLRVTAKNINVQKKDKTIHIQAPKLYLSFSLRALLKGIIAPSDISLEKPEMYVFASYGVEQENQDEVSKKKLQFYIESFKEFLNNYNSAEKIYPESFVNNIHILNGEIEFHEVDLGKKWILSDVNFEFSRKLINMDINANALVNINDKIASLGFESEYHAADDKLDLEIYFSDLILSDMVSTFNDTTEDNMLSMMSIEIPVNGKISTNVFLTDILNHPQEAQEYLDGAVEQIRFEIDGGHGYVSFNEDEKYNYNIDEVSLSGEINGGIDEIRISDATLKLGRQQAKISLQANGLETYFLENSLKDLAVRFTANIDEFPLADLSVFWPRYLAEPAWEWCKDGLIGGVAQKAQFIFDFGFDRKQNAWGLLNLSGKADMSDVDIFYLEGMPVVKNVYGLAKFSQDKIVIDIDKGNSDGVIVTDGVVKIYDLDKERNYITINLVGNSSISETLRLIDHQPLQIASDIGIKPEDITGDIDLKLKLDFELSQSLTAKDIKVDVKSDMKNVVMSKLVTDHVISADAMKLNVNSAGWNLSGDAQFDDIPVKLTMDENFANKSYKNKCRLSFVLDDKAKKALGIDWKILSAPNIEGFVMVNADVSVDKNDLIDVFIKADLKNTKIDYAYLGFVKDMSQAGEVNAHVMIKNNKVTSIQNMSLIKPGFTIGGNVSMYPNGRVHSVDIHKISGPKTSARSKITLTDAAVPQIKVEISGTSFDLTPLFDKDKKDASDNKTAIQENEDDGLENVNNTDIFMTVNSLWTNATTPIQNFAGSAKLRHGIGLDELHMVGNYGVDKSIKLNVDYAPRDNGEHYVSIDSNNAGSTLKVLRLYENMVGGTLKIEARRDKQKKFIGHAIVRDFSIQNAPVMAQLLSVASLTGMLDLLKGDGLTFTHFNAPFEYQYKILKLKKAKAEGNVVGITTSGNYNRATDNFNMYGVIAPAYSINRFLGKIPVVGNLLASKDGTIFAADYKIDGSVEKPQIDINSLSILSPNSMKEWYNENFGNSDEL